MNTFLKQKTFLITGISDSGSLATEIARQTQQAGAKIVCSGLGKTEFHAALSDKAQRFLDQNFSDFRQAVTENLGTEVPVFALDLTLDQSIEAFALKLKQQNITIDGFLHSVAMDKTIRRGKVKPLLEVSREEFFSAMDISAYSLIALTRALLRHGVLNRGASIVALSYLGAEKITFHPYKNIGVAKLALERIARELAVELGQSHGLRLNVLRFSPYKGSKAGNATLSDEVVQHAGELSPLGNATPADLAHEAVHLFRPTLRTTGEVRYVDGGYHTRG